MLRFAAILALVALAQGLPKPKIEGLNGKVVGGEAANIADHPYQVSVQYYGTHVCGGSVISAKVVLTACHCTNGWDHPAFSIRAGSSKHNSGGQEIKVASIKEHKQFVTSPTYDFDVALLVLQSSLVLQPNAVAPIQLQTQELQPNTVVTVTGWGKTSTGGETPEQLRRVNVNIFPRDECQKRYPSEKLSERMICAMAPGKDACQGDSGGPLVLNGGKFQVGIVSWGYDCADPEHPGVYANVANLRSWIMENAF